MISEANMKINRLLLTAVAAAMITGCQAPAKTEKELPLPELESGMRGELGIDKNINEATIDEYLSREDSVYRDMRMLKDEANYEAIGGDSYLSGYVDGFEVVPYPYLCNVVGLPEEVGDSYTGKTLFTIGKEGSLWENYEESMDILEYYFPKDKTIFLMCGGGGYAGMTKHLLVSLGWDENKIYNTGGYWYYEGKNKVEVKREENGKVYYDFYKVPYHYIDFDSLHPMRDEDPFALPTEEPVSEVVPESEHLTSIADGKELNKLIDEGSRFVLYVYLPGCTSCASFKPVIEAVAESGQADFRQVSYTDLKDVETPVTSIVEYTPSVFVFEGGEVKAYLDPVSDEDLPYYKTAEAFSEWLSQYIDIDVVTSDAVNENTDCDDSCSVEMTFDN
jgi:thiol-disulfide isomerase/thioredoxin